MSLWFKEMNSQKKTEVLSKKNKNFLLKYTLGKKEIMNKIGLGIILNSYQWIGAALLLKTMFLQLQAVFFFIQYEKWHVLVYYALDSV